MVKHSSVFPVSASNAFETASIHGNGMLKMAEQESRGLRQALCLLMEMSAKALSKEEDFTAPKLLWTSAQVLASRMYHSLQFMTLRPGASERPRKLGPQLLDSDSVEGSKHFLLKFGRNI